MSGIPDSLVQSSSTVLYCPTFLNTSITAMETVDCECHSKTQISVTNLEA